MIHGVKLLLTRTIYNGNFQYPYFQFSSVFLSFRRFLFSYLTNVPSIFTFQVTSVFKNADSGKALARHVCRGHTGESKNRDCSLRGYPGRHEYRWSTREPTKWDCTDDKGSPRWFFRIWKFTSEVGDVGIFKTIMFRVASQRESITCVVCLSLAGWTLRIFNRNSSRKSISFTSIWETKLEKAHASLRHLKPHNLCLYVGFST